MTYSNTARAFKIAAAALLTLTLSANAAFAIDDFKSGGQPKLKATKIQLGILSPNDGTCPSNAKRNVWVFSNKPGNIPILIVRKNGAVEGPYIVETKKGANNKSMGVWSDQLGIVNSIDAEYRIVTPGTDVASNWVPLQVNC